MATYLSSLALLRSSHLLYIWCYMVERTEHSYKLAKKWGGVIDTLPITYFYRNNHIHLIFGSVLLIIRFMLAR